MRAGTAKQQVVSAGGTEHPNRRKGTIRRVNVELLADRWMDGDCVLGVRARALTKSPLCEWSACLSKTRPTSVDPTTIDLRQHKRGQTNVAINKPRIFKHTGRG